MGIYYKEFVSDEEAILEAQEFKTQGVHESDIYILTNDRARTKDLADKASANKVGLAEEGLGKAVANMFKSKEEGFQTKLEELGFNKSEATRLAEKLQQNKIIIVASNTPADFKA